MLSEPASRSTSPAAEPRPSRRAALTLGLGFLASGMVARGARAGTVGSSLDHDGVAHGGGSTGGATSSGSGATGTGRPFAGSAPPPLDNLRPIRPKAKMQGVDKDDKSLPVSVKPMLDPTERRRRVLARLGWGVTLDDLERFTAGGATLDEQALAWIDAQLSTDSLSAGSTVATADDAVARLDVATSGLGRRERLDLETLTRRVHGAQVVERLVAFWHRSLDVLVGPLPAARLAARDAAIRSDPGGDGAGWIADPARRATLPRRLVVELTGGDDRLLVAAAERAFAAAGGRIDATLRAVVVHPSFGAPSGAAVPPLDAALAMLRSLELDVPTLAAASPEALREALATLGQPILPTADSASLDGRPHVWSDTRSRAASWAFGEWLTRATDAAGTPLLDVGAVFSGPPSARAVVDGWSSRLLGRPLEGSARDAFLALAAAGSRDRLASLVAALLTAPDFHTR